MTQIGPDLSPKCAYFTFWPKISTSFVLASTCGAWAPYPQYRVLDPITAFSFRHLHIAPLVQPRYPHLSLFNFAIFSEFIAPLLPLVCSPSKLWSTYLYPLGCRRLNHSAITTLYVTPCHHLLIFANFDDFMPLHWGY
jgi:hypothetical protein